MRIVKTINRNDDFDVYYKNVSVRDSIIWDNIDYYYLDIFSERSQEIKNVIPYISSNELRFTFNEENITIFCNQNTMIVPLSIPEEIREYVKVYFNKHYISKAEESGDQILITRGNRIHVVYDGPKELGLIWKLAI